MKIELQKVIFEVESADDAIAAFLDTETGESKYLYEEPFAGETDPALAELIEDNPGRFLRFPTKYDIHEYHIMESFIEQLPAGAAQERLMRAIQGKGAFRRFKDMVITLGLEQHWYSYQAESYREIALRWCRDNNLEAVEEGTTEQK